jgi:hypothetical protein
MFSVKNSGDHILVLETPDMYAHTVMQDYITKETKRPNKQWVGQVLQGLQEQEFVQLKHDHYILLPDAERVNRYTDVAKGPVHSFRHRGGGPRRRSPHCTNNNNATANYKDLAASKPILNWLAITTDKNIRTMRDLTGEHIDMLIDLQTKCLDTIERVTGIDPNRVMVYLHYHPSVYHLHVHFAYPYMQYNHKDAYRMHPLSTVISNLQIDRDFYQKAHIPVSLNSDSPLCKVYKTIKAS